MPNKRILIVDDEDVIRVSDVILFDFMMPGLDGPSTYTRLRDSEATRNIPVIFLTAKVQKSDHAFLMNLGAQGIIAKPFDPLPLTRQIEEILSW